MSSRSYRTAGGPAVGPPTVGARPGDGRARRGQTRRVGARLGLVVAAGLAGVLGLAAPAWAHGADAPDGTNYRTEVVGTAPATSGLTVRAIESGARLELTNRTGRTIEVLGYRGEPYLEIRPDGVYENLYSPATYLNRTLDGDTEVPATADPTLPPDWRRTGTEPVARWHDQRTHWLEEAAPAQVRAEPDQRHRIRDWVVPLRDGGTAIELRGTLDWLPPPSPATWWAFAVLGALAVAALGLLPTSPRAAPGRRPTPVVTVTLAVLAGLAGLGAIGFALARQLDGASAGLGGILAGLLTGQTWSTLSGLGALAAAGYALARRPAADFALALAGACLAIFGGAVNAAVFTRSVAPVPWPGGAARVLVATVIALGAGVAAASALRLRTAARTAAWEPDDEQILASDGPWRGQDAPTSG
jgi:hypothetical protein